MFRTNSTGKSFSLDKPPFLTNPELTINTTITAVTRITPDRYAGQAVLGKALSGGMRETVDWVKARYGQTFDAIYVPPGQKVALHITRQLAIDYEEKGRKVKYDNFSLAGSSTGMD